MERARYALAAGAFIVFFGHVDAEYFFLFTIPAAQTKMILLTWTYLERSNMAVHSVGRSGGEHGMAHH